MKRYLYLAIYFALGMFAVFECDSLFGELSGTLLGSGSVGGVYGAGCISAAFGVLLFLLIKKQRLSHIRGFLICTFPITAALPALAFAFQSIEVFWSALILFYIAEGLNATVCAFYLYKVRLEAPTIKAGIMLAVATTLGLVVNYGVDFIFAGQPIVRIVLLAAVVLTMMFLAFKKIDLARVIGLRESMAGATKPVGTRSGRAAEPGGKGSGRAAESGGKGSSRATESGGKVRIRDDERRRFLPVLLTVAAAIAVISYMIGVNDVAIFTSLLSNGGETFFWTQLLYIPGLLIAGVIADVKDGKFLPIATIGCTFLTAPTVIYLDSPDSFMNYSGIAFFLGGFYLIYIMISLVAIADRARRPYVVTSTAAFIFYLFCGIGAFTSKIYLNAEGYFSLTVFIGFSVLLLIIFYLSGSMHPRVSATYPEQSSVPAMPSLEELTAGYGITNREMEVLQLLIVGKTTSEIAEDMIITEKSVQNYVSSMLSKTGSKSRGNMIARFTGRADSDHIPVPTK